MVFIFFINNGESMADTQKNTPEICAIVAVGPDNVIGLNGAMPWHSRADFYHFKKMTMGYPVVFGKNTFFGLPKYPLPKRLNIVCSSAYKTTNLGDFVCATSLEDAIKYCHSFKKLFICGGAELYKYSLNHDYIDVMYLTKLVSPELSAEIAQNPAIYTRFPVDINVFFNPKKWSWEQISYLPGILPKENTNIIAEFFKCTRVR